MLSAIREVKLKPPPNSEADVDDGEIGIAPAIPRLLTKCFV